MNSWRDVIGFFIYAIALLNCWVWLITPAEYVGLWMGMMWKWDIFITLLFAPLIYKGIKDEKQKN